MVPMFNRMMVGTEVAWFEPWHSQTFPPALFAQTAGKYVAVVAVVVGTDVAHIFTVVDTDIDDVADSDYDAIGVADLIAVTNIADSDYDAVGAADVKDVLIVAQPVADFVNFLKYHVQLLLLLSKDVASLVDQYINVFAVFTSLLLLT